MNGPRRPSQILVCVDNQSALTTLSTGNPTNAEFARQALLTIKQLSDDGWSISGLRTPAHCGIPGYEKADALAKLGAAQPGNLECCNARVTKSWLQAKAHSQQVEDWTARHPRTLSSRSSHQPHSRPTYIYTAASPVSAPDKFDAIGPSPKQPARTVPPWKGARGGAHPLGLPPPPSSPQRDLCTC